MKTQKRSKTSSKSLRRAVYPGSFDPLTIGHQDIIERLLPQFDEIIVLISHSANKSYWFSPKERKQMAEKVFEKMGQVRVEIYDGLTVDFAKKAGAAFILRGLRVVADFEYEMGMANMNARLAPEIETLICFSRPEYNYISSRMVKEVALYGGDVKGLVPEHIGAALKRKVKELKR